MKDINYALMLIKANKFEGAKDLLEELLQHDPGNQDVLYNLGMCYTELDEPEKAVKTLAECIRYYPHYSNAYVALGFAYLRLANDEKAKDHFLMALEIEPSNPYALRNLGGLYGKENDYDNAIQCLEKSFSINPEDQQTAYGLGYSYFHIGKIDKADKYFKIAIDLDESTKIADTGKRLKERNCRNQPEGKRFQAGCHVLLPFGAAILQG